MAMQVDATSSFSNCSAGCLISYLPVCSNIAFCLLGFSLLCCSYSHFTFFVYFFTKIVQVASGYCGVDPAEAHIRHKRRYDAFGVYPTLQFCLVASFNSHQFSHAGLLDLPNCLLKSFFPKDFLDDSRGCRDEGGFCFSSSLLAFHSMRIFNNRTWCQLT